MSGVFLSRFTPSVLSPETLEAIFVQRERLASTLVERISTSALTPNKHYSLIIGPRGIGKTHLVSLVYHRVKGDDRLSDRLLCAWLREEEWGITSFLDFLLSILRTLCQDLGDARREAAYQGLFELPAEQAEPAAEQLLRDMVGDRTLLVIVENLDEILEGMEEAGQQKLRAYIQNHPCWTILGTSQSLFTGVSLQESPFYGFFEVTHLRELSFKDAVTLLIKIATHHGDRELARDLHTTLGRSRIRAVHHLAAGNPRVYVILSQFLTSRSLDQLVEPLMRTLDDLTPYYQARMSYLSPQQRKLVEFLCERRGAVAVKEIAKHNFLTHPTASGQLKKLRELGYVRPAQRVGRESFFELREPLMRLSMEVKRQRGEPIRLLVDFLRLWFSQDELRERLDDLEDGSALDKRYLVRAMESYDEGSGDPRVEACLKDYERFWAEGAYEKALQVAEELVEIRGFSWEWEMRSRCLDALGEGEATQPIDRQALELAAEAYEETALSNLREASRLQPEDAWAWFRLANYLDYLGRYEEALAAVKKATKLDSSSVLFWSYLGVFCYRCGRLEESLESLDRALAFKPENPGILSNRAVALSSLGRHEEALAAFDRAIELLDDATTFHLETNRAVILMLLGRWEEGLEALERALTRFSEGEIKEDFGEIAIVRNMLLRTQRDETWRRHVEVWIELFERHDRLTLLGQGLVRTIRTLTIPWITSEMAQAWNTVWQELGAGKADMTISLRLFNAAVNYRESGDERVLLALPAEERALLKPLLETGQDEPEPLG